MIDHKFSVAPMIDCTDRHFRYFARLLSKKAVLYTEMITSGAVLHATYDHLEYNDTVEHPVILQLGGNNPHDLAKCAKLAAVRKYSGINLNVGCPSNRVQNGAFGVCMMKQPDLLADIYTAMSDAVELPISIKTRIGVDEYDSYDFLCSLVDKVSSRGCKQWIIHARKAWLQGLSPKQNRDIPPLKYDVVYKLKQDFPELDIVINGGIENFTQIKEHLNVVDGVMLGRKVYKDPFCLTEVDSTLFGAADFALTRQEIILKMLPYIERHIKNDGRISNITKHLLNLFHSTPNGKLWRRFLTENVPARNQDLSVVTDALAILEK